MELKINTFKKAISAGQKQVGVWNSLCSNIASDALASSGYDWALLDMEHSPNDFRTVLSQLQAYENGSTSAIVRPVWNEPVIVKSLLDMGAQSLLFPMVQNADEARKAVAATRYPPDGMRGVSASQRGNRYGRVKDYLHKAHEQICVLVQIETLEAVGNIPEIAAVDGVDGIFFGPADLAADMGIMGQLASEELWATIARGVEAGTAAGVPAGTLVGTAQKALEVLDGGMTYVACGSDLNLMVGAADAQLAAIRSGLS